MFLSLTYLIVTATSFLTSHVLADSEDCWRSIQLDEFDYTPEYTANDPTLWATTMVFNPLVCMDMVVNGAYLRDLTSGAERPCNFNQFDSLGRTFTTCDTSLGAIASSRHQFWSYNVKFQNGVEDEWYWQDFFVTLPPVVPDVAGCKQSLSTPNIQSPVTWSTSDPTYFQVLYTYDALKCLEVPVYELLLNDKDTHELFGCEMKSFDDTGVMETVCGKTRGSMAFSMDPNWSITIKIGTTPDLQEVETSFIVLASPGIDPKDCLLTVRMPNFDDPKYYSLNDPAMYRVVYSFDHARCAGVPVYEIQLYDRDAGLVYGCTNPPFDNTGVFESTCERSLGSMAAPGHRNWVSTIRLGLPDVGLEERQTVFRVVPTASASVIPRRKRRDLEEKGIYGAAPSVPVCRKGDEICPRVGGWGWDCIDTQADVTSCGGCRGASEDSNDCSTFAGVDDVVCWDGRCVILSCDVDHVYQLGECVPFGTK